MTALGWSRVPRPPHHPVLGHFPDWMGTARARKVLDTVLGYAETCGGLARVPLGPASLLVLSDPEPIATLLQAESANVKGWPYRLTRVVLDNVLLLNGDDWARARVQYRRALRGVDAMGAVDAALEPFLGHLRTADAVDLGPAVSQLAADAVCALLVSDRYDPALEPHRARVQHELAAVGIDLQCQPWAYLSPARWVALRRSVTAMRAWFMAHVRRRQADPGAHDDVLAGFAAAAGEGHGSAAPEALRDGLVNVFFTAHDVLTAATSWCLWLLARHPETQAAIRRGEPDALACAVRESLRLYPGYPLFSRRTQAPLELDGHLVPAGVDVIVSPWVVHRLARHWPDPLAFRPERWAGRTEQPVGPGPRGAYLPFGGGHRSCIAFAMALPMLTRVVERVVAEVELEAQPGHEPDVVYWGSASSANGLPVRVRTVG
ncbi:MAG: cytochrome P450 [Alphaproteobacteria bacterium]|nr:cytochrome P450 [Alphaproteobacteria bacterium]